MLEERTVIAYLKNLFRQPTAPELVLRELAEARLAKLEAQTAVDYATAIVAYNDARIARLVEYTNTAGKVGAK
jgi:hypothetical protein